MKPWLWLCTKKKRGNRRIRLCMWWAKEREMPRYAVELEMLSQRHFRNVSQHILLILYQHFGIDSICALCSPTDRIICSQFHILYDCIQLTATRLTVVYRVVWRRTMTGLAERIRIEAFRIKIVNHKYILTHTRSRTAFNLNEWMNDRIKFCTFTWNTQFIYYHKTPFYPQFMFVGTAVNRESNAGAITKCAAGGRDHTSCCIRRGVSSTCLPYCRGLLPETPVDCLAMYGGSIIQCYDEGK